MQNDNQKLDIHKYYRMIKKRKYILLIPFVLIVSYSIKYAITQEPLYESSTTILVAQRKLMSDNLGRLVQRVDQNMQLTILARVILSAENLDRLIKKVNLEPDDKLKSKAAAIKTKYPDLKIGQIEKKLLFENLTKRIKITTIRKSFLKITVEGKSRDKVYLIAKTLAELSMARILEGEYESIKQSIEFSTQQLKIYEEKLRDSEEKLEKFQQTLAIRPEKNSPKSFKSGLEHYNSMLSSLKGEIVQKRNEINEVDSRLKEKGFNSKFPASKNFRNFGSQYIKTSERLLKNEIQFSADDPNVIKLNKQIGILRRQMITEIRTIANSQMAIKDDELIPFIVLKEMAKIDIGLLKKKRYELTKLIKEYKTEVAQKPIQEATLAKLQREVETNREIYDAFLKQSQGSYIGEALQKREAAFKFEIIEAAYKPMERSNSKKKIVIICGFFAVIVSFALFSIVEFLDNSFTDIKEIENYLQISVLGAIPKLEYLKKSRKKIALYFAIPTIVIGLFVYMLTILIKG